MATPTPSCIVNVHETIFHRVPEFLRKRNEEYYTPKVVSIGPYHYPSQKEEPTPSQKEGLAKMEDVKELFFLNLISRSPGSKEEDYLEAVESIANDALSMYSSGGRICQEYLDELPKRMVIDGCFIIELFLDPFHKDVHRRARIPGNVSSKELVLLHTDILLAENQIPFVVLQKLFDVFKASHIPVEPEHLKKLTNGKSTSDITFTELALAYFMNDDLIGDYVTKFYNESNGINKMPFDHLLHLYHSIWDRSFRTSDSPKTTQGPTNTNTNYLILILLIPFVLLYILARFGRFLWQCLQSLVSLPFRIFAHALILFRRLKGYEPWPSPEQPKLDGALMMLNAKRLHDMGIKLRMNVNRSDISLLKEELKIPLLRIHRRTITVFWNIVAFEEQESHGTKDFTAFVTFMDMLIDSEKDVILLKRCGIIESQGGTGQEVADFFNNLGNVTYLDRDGHALEEQFKKLRNYYYDNRAEVMFYGWKQMVIPNYMQEWEIPTIPAIIVGVLLLLPGAVQAIKGIYSLFNPASPQTQLISVY